jgi:hypothetical protein
MVADNFCNRLQFINVFDGDIVDEFNNKMINFIGSGIEDNISEKLQNLYFKIENDISSGQLILQPMYIFGCISEYCNLSDAFNVQRHEIKDFLDKTIDSIVPYVYDSIRFGKHEEILAFVARAHFIDGAFDMVNIELRKLFDVVIDYELLIDSVEHFKAELINIKNTIRNVTFIDGDTAVERNVMPGVALDRLFMLH